MRAKTSVDGSFSLVQLLTGRLPAVSQVAPPVLSLVAHSSSSTLNLSWAAPECVSCHVLEYEVELYEDTSVGVSLWKRGLSGVIATSPTRDMSGWTGVLKEATRLGTGVQTRLGLPAQQTSTEFRNIKPGSRYHASVRAIAGAFLALQSSAQIGGSRAAQNVPLLVWPNNMDDLGLKHPAGLALQWTGRAVLCLRVLSIWIPVRICKDDGWANRWGMQEQQHRKMPRPASGRA